MTMISPDEKLVDDFLARWHGHTNAEISRLTGLSYSTVCRLKQRDVVRLYPKARRIMEESIAGWGVPASVSDATETAVGALSLEEEIRPNGEPEPTASPTPGPSWERPLHISGSTASIASLLITLTMLALAHLLN